MPEIQRTRLADLGQVWIPWDPEQAFADERLARAVSEFEAVPCPAGWAAERWLKEDALANHGLTLTYVALLNMRVEGFYTMRAGDVVVSTSHQKTFALPHPRQGVALLVWLAKCGTARLSGLELLAHALERARAVARLQGIAGIALDPFDAASGAVWRRPPYEFMKSETKLPNGLKRLWKPLDDAVKAAP